MDYNVITMLLQTAPSAIAVVATVVLFLRFLNAESVRDNHIADLRIKDLERIGLNCHDHTKELNDKAIKSIEHAARAIEDNTKIICVMERRLNGKIS